MSKWLKVLALLVIAAVLVVVPWLIWGHGNGNALWRIVSQQCVPDQRNTQNPAPCLVVDLEQHYVLFKDRLGPLHDLTIPTDRITGIESPLLLEDNAYAFFANAWQQRGRLAAEAGKPIKDEFLSLAVNSRYGRSQGQLHIHLACLRPEVRTLLDQHGAQVTGDWQPLGSRLNGHEYLAKRLDGQDLALENPFKVLGDYVRQQDDSMSRYGLALVVAPGGDLLLLANRLSLGDFNLGSAGEIQDYGCALAR
ncbi:CDP-diacylglycerol diphosphatase [Pseudomonas gingeri NCPPB 3146 = LMG 5327]|uniref:CDP-diacylglycerol pyrophosphatase n=2 Tax=Pseudomonas gingeri TaxID=117681 RepID=A0A7Y7XUN2_9PSED|nr:CDP-diacylglycerol diphosphatase [Pseudomonas gingeri]NWC12411.1 CDP-diacylglycerol diphosphatase [Pseudomonas gingeri]NWE48492.1 CDP-diacylglycerol diphosphatase [Pseudomonas gingeri]PNQ89170.1 CDP-diacylglycerol diphosphatase [Pseudomonas gingeri NCPPB 3146 = LMG 5327]